MSDWSDDDELLDALRDALRKSASTPQEAIESAKAIYTWRTIDAELAALTSDSADQPSPVLRNDPAALRSLEFRVNDHGIALEIDSDQIYAQLIPPTAGHIDLYTADGQHRSYDADATGYFRITPRPQTDFRLLCAPQGRPAFHTGWIRLAAE